MVPLSAVEVRAAEIVGADVLRHGPAARRLEAWFAGPEGPQALFAGRVLSFDEKAGLAWARLMADGKARGNEAAPQ